MIVWYGQKPEKMETTYLTNTHYQYIISQVTTYLTNIHYQYVISQVTTYLTNTYYQ